MSNFSRRLRLASTLVLTVAAVVPTAAIAALRPSGDPIAVESGAPPDTTAMTSTLCAAVAPSPDGGFFASWTADVQDGPPGSGTASFPIARHFAADASPTTDALTLEGAPALLVPQPDGSSLAIGTLGASRLEASGAQSSLRRFVDGPRSTVLAATRADGGAAVVWRTLDAPPKIFARHLDSEGVEVGEAATLVAPGPAVSALFPLSWFGAGDLFGLAWGEHATSDGLARPQSFVGFFNGEGYAATSPVALGRLRAAVGDGGAAGFVLATTDEEAALLHRFDATGRQQGRATQLDPGPWRVLPVAVAVAPNGNFVVAWLRERGAPKYKSELLARVFSHNGRAKGAPIKIRLEVRAGACRPLAATADGEWLAVYRQPGGGIHVQRYVDR
jgi:hypothetical protein